MNKRFNNYSIGIIGGAGPMASCLIYKLLIEECQRSYACIDDQDYPLIFTLNYPFSSMLDYSRANKNSNILRAQLENCFNILTRNKVSIGVIACNTLHTFLPAVKNNNNFKLLDIVQTVKEYCTHNSLKKVLVLGTQTTVKSHLYKYVAPEVIYPSSKEQTQVSNIISRILKGEILPTDVSLLENIVSTILKQRNFDAIILGCTELSVLNDKYTLLQALSLTNLKVIDTLKLISKKLLASISN